MYFDTDVILALLKADDWLRPMVNKYDRLNFFDAIHLGTAQVLGEVTVSTDTLYPSIADIESIDPRDRNC